jgi:hypothetical protein
MLVVDDILLAPFKGLLWVARKIDEAAEEELRGRHGEVKSQLSELYMQLETGRITEEEFDAREKVLLDRLDEIERIQAHQAGQGGGEQPDTETDR